MNYLVKYCFLAIVLFLAQLASAQDKQFAKIGDLEIIYNGIEQPNAEKLTDADPTACDSRHPGMELLAPPRLRKNPLNNDVEIICVFAGADGITPYEGAATFVFCPADFVVRNVGYSVLSGGILGDSTIIRRTTRVLSAIPIVLSDKLSQAQVSVMKTAPNGIAGIVVFARCSPV